MTLDTHKLLRLPLVLLRLHGNTHSMKHNVDFLSQQSNVAFIVFT